MEQQDTLAPEGRYDGWPLRIFSTEALRRQAGPAYYVWSYEGQFDNGKWRFHGGKVMDGETEIDCPEKPLLVDASSARGWWLIYDAVNDKNKAKLDEYARSRGLTCWAFDQLIWPNLSFGRT